MIQNPPIDDIDVNLTSNKSLEPKLENELRPHTLTEFIGQKTVKQQLSIVLNAAKKRNMSPDHILLAGPPGLGKTTLAMLISTELEKPLKISSGPAIQHAGDLASILSSLTDGEVLFIDEIHRLSRPVEEMLYVAMEDFRVDIIVGKGPGANAIPLEIPHFVVVGATTRSGLLPAPLRDRFGFTANMDFYPTQELAKIIKRSANILSISITKDATIELASRSRGTPRIANRLLKRTRDYAEIYGASTKNKGIIEISVPIVQKALEIYRVDEYGLDSLDRKILKIIIDANKPVGISTISAHTGEEKDTIENTVEPYLLRAGLIQRTTKGRIATIEAFNYFNIKPKDSLF